VIVIIVYGYITIKKLVLNSAGKCLYVMNSQNPRMIDCTKLDEQINHHIHFKIINKKKMHLLHEPCRSRNLFELQN